MQLLSAEVAGEVIFRQNDQHSTTGVHTIGHVFHDGLAKLEVPVVDAVRNGVLLNN